MSFVHVIVLVLPMLVGQPQLPDSVAACRDRVHDRLSGAVQTAAEYQPAWERNVREVLAADPAYADRLVVAIRSAASASGLEAQLLWSVAYTESRGRHWKAAGSVKRGGACEVGLMQVLPFWERALRRVYDLELDLYELEDNLLAGAYILRRGGDETAVMLSYYNTGSRVRSTPYQRRVMGHMASYQ